MDKDFKRVLFSYLDSQDFIQIEKNNNIYFVNSEGDKYAQIRYEEKNGWCRINLDLIKEISSFFSLAKYESQQVIGRWVENTLQMKVTNTALPEKYFWSKVENTPQLIFTQKQITL